MDILKKLKSSAKDVPTAVWIAGIVIPFGLTAIAAYVAYKTANKPAVKSTLQEELDKIKAEVENESR